MNSYSKTKQIRLKRLIKAVGELYDSHPGVKMFKLSVGADGVLRRRGYTWYREPWMNEILNAYRLLKAKGN